jgi:K+-sensing histidine kinase KdpD
MNAPRARETSEPGVPDNDAPSVESVDTRGGDSVVESRLATSIGAMFLLIFSMALVPMRDFLGAANVAIILLLGVQLVALLGGIRGGVVGALVAALSFDFFFTEPYLRLVIADRRDIITMVLLLAGGLLTSMLHHQGNRGRMRR